jgi:hypothetical protein
MYYLVLLYVLYKYIYVCYIGILIYVQIIGVSSTFILTPFNPSFFTTSLFDKLLHLVVKPSAQEGVVDFCFDLRHNLGHIAPKQDLT